ncbi:hypothetical protein SISNIDRAFT_455297 [Sistotremastrum niveocremeum HHB9708]|uniref:F-box domain-containing protein n=1 Tax=Sistotremastrum niveocremeum HHB9708 TaxID=1314777 RepID=A0A164TWM4_9AGAM|nr:hypothetical protein SISNIDRAFT_455297 [Sistotremastrum niveocremeum HHB9708]
MSCSICLLPIYPSSKAHRPQVPPDGVLTESQKKFFRTAVAMGRSVPGAVLGMEYLGYNNFASLPPREGVSITWETDDETEFVMHATCSHIFSVVMGIPLVYTKMERHHMRFISEFEIVFGRAQGGTEDGVGRLQRLDYERACGVDLRQYWHSPAFEGDVTFDWTAIKAGPHAWALVRPNMFPSFSSKVTSTRLASVAEPEETSDVFTSLPFDIIHKIVGLLDMRTFVSATSTCRTMRRYAIGDFQPLARKHVLAIPWAIPLLNSDPEEYTTPNQIPHATKSPHDADWLLYLSYIHRTDSMRERRRIWAICEEFKRCYARERRKVIKHRNWPKTNAIIEKMVDDAETAMVMLQLYNSL